MKKLFLSFMLVASSFGLMAGGMHAPAAGPVQLGDAVNGQQGVLRGAIMKAVIDHNPINVNTNPTLAAANAAIAQFDGQGQSFRSYQAIITNIGQSINTQLAIDAVKAFESVIMHLYDYDAYMIGGYKPGLSVFMPTGIRWSWINPLTYLSLKSYFSDNDDRLKQLINELDKLANVVKIHSSAEYLRIKATAESYRNWRRNTMLAIAAYLAADSIHNGWNNSIVNQFYQGGFENLDEMVVNHMINFGDAVYCVGKGIGKVGSCAFNVGARVGSVMLHGKKAFAKQAAVVENKPEQKMNSEIKIKKLVPKISQPDVVVAPVVHVSLPESKNFDYQTMENFERARFQATVKNPVKIEPSVVQKTDRQKAWSSMVNSCGNVIKIERNLREERKQHTFNYLHNLIGPSSGWNKNSYDNQPRQLVPVVVGQKPIETVQVLQQATIDPVVTQPKHENEPNNSVNLKRAAIVSKLHTVVNSLSGQDEKKLVQLRNDVAHQVTKNVKKDLEKAQESVVNSFHQAVHDARAQTKDRAFWKEHFKPGNLII